MKRNVEKSLLCKCAKHVVQKWCEDSVPYKDRLGLTKGDFGFDSEERQYRLDSERIPPGSVTLMTDWVRFSGLTDLEHNDEVGEILAGLTAAARKAFHPKALVKHLGNVTIVRHQYYLAFPPETNLNEDQVEKMITTSLNLFYRQLDEHFEVN